MKQQNIKKIKEAIRDNRLKIPAGLSDENISLYATYLYALRSHARGHLHMAVWNKHHPYKMSADTTKSWLVHPLAAGKFEFSSLDDQAVWIGYVKEFISRAQNAKYNSEAWKTLTLDFDEEVDERLQRVYRDLRTVMPLPIKKANLFSKIIDFILG